MTLGHNITEELHEIFIPESLVIKSNLLEQFPSDAHMPKVHGELFFEFFLHGNRP